MSMLATAAKGPPCLPVSTILFKTQALQHGHRSECLSHHEEVPRATPGPHPALFAADAERCQGIDHARGDGAAVRAAPGALRCERAALTGVRLCEPQQQDPGHPRSERARW